MDERERRQPYYRHGPLGAISHKSERNPVPASWVAFLAMHQEIRDTHIHQQVQKDQVEHLWRLKGEA